jgi:general secretion pathway protein D
LEDGEINLVGGILEDSETRSLGGYPWLAKLPILKYLFGQETKDHSETEIVFAITPHIVRAEEITDENLRLIDVGTSNTIGLRYKEPKPTKPSNPAAQETPSSKNRKRPSTGVAGPVQALPRPSEAQSP